MKVLRTLNQLLDVAVYETMVLAPEARDSQAAWLLEYEAIGFGDIAAAHVVRVTGHTTRHQ